MSEMSITTRAVGMIGPRELADEVAINGQSPVAVASIRLGFWS